MLKKLLANKKWLILIVILVLVGILITVFILKDSEEKGKSNISIETEHNKDGETSKEDGEDEAYNEKGLEAQDTLDESVYTIDGSGDWTGTSDGNNKKEQGNKTDNVPSDDTQSEDAPTEDKEKEDSNDKSDNADGELDNDILVDDKVWGEVN